MCFSEIKCVFLYIITYWDKFSSHLNEGNSWAIESILTSLFLFSMNIKLAFPPYDKITNLIWGQWKIIANVFWSWTNDTSIKHSPPPSILGEFMHVFRPLRILYNKMLIRYHFAVMWWIDPQKEKVQGCGWPYHFNNNAQLNTCFGWPTDRW